MVVIGIEHITDISCQILLLHRLLVLALVKAVQTKGVHRPGLPDPQGVHHIVAVTYNRKIIGYSQNRLIALLDEFLFSILPYSGHSASEFYFLGIFRVAHLKWVAVL